MKEEQDESTCAVS